MIGCTKKVLHPDGKRKITITIPPGGLQQHVYAEIGAGLTAITGEVGDLLLQGHLTFPVLNMKQRAILKESVEKMAAVVDSYDPSESEDEIEGIEG